MFEDLWEIVSGNIKVMKAGLTSAGILSKAEISSRVTESEEKGDNVVIHAMMRYHNV